MKSIPGRALLVCACLVAIALMPGRVFSQGPRTFYVSVEGHDANPGTIEQPFRTIGRGVRTLSAGDVLYIRQGVYHEEVGISSSGTAAQPIRIMAYPGEKPVIDGDNYRLPRANWGVLLNLVGSYIEVSGLEVRNSNWMGVVLNGPHNRVSYLDVHHNKENGILIKGDYGIVEDSRVWWNCASNEYGITQRDGWASGLSAARSPNHATIRRNVVYHNWGEGLSTYEANGTLIEDNILYDNHSNIYISDATHILVRRNLVYATGTVMQAGSRVGIMMGDERYSPPSSNIAIINNLVLGANRNFYWWQGVQGGGMRNVLIAHNTFVNSAHAAGIVINNGPHDHVNFTNNIVRQDDALPVASVPRQSNVAFSNNLWSKAPPAVASSPSDIIGDPRLAQVGSVDAGLLTPDWFKLLADSPAIDRARRMDEVQEDYFGIARGVMPDIGAYEYMLPTSTPTPPAMIPTVPPPTIPAPWPTIAPSPTVGAPTCEDCHRIWITCVYVTPHGLSVGPTGTCYADTCE
jgi:hypothetical protein